MQVIPLYLRVKEKIFLNKHLVLMNKVFLRRNSKLENEKNVED